MIKVQQVYTINFFTFNKQGEKRTEKKMNDQDKWLGLISTHDQFQQVYTTSFNF